jgi:hypothetical protein
MIRTVTRCIFEIECSDPDYITGLTTEHYEKLVAAILALGGDQIDFEKVIVEDVDDYRVRKAKL